MTIGKISSYINKGNNSLNNLVQKASTLERWNKILSDCLGCDKDIMKHCHAVKIEHNSLVIIAESPHWVSKLKFKTPEILSKLKAHKELANVKSIICKSLPFSNFKKRKEITIREPLQINRDTAEYILEIANTIQDPKLKAILIKIASH